MTIPSFHLPTPGPPPSPTLTTFFKFRRRIRRARCAPGRIPAAWRGARRTGMPSRVTRSAPPPAATCARSAARVRVHRRSACFSSARRSTCRLHRVTLLATYRLAATVALLAPCSGAVLPASSYTHRWLPFSSAAFAFTSCLLPAAYACRRRHAGGSRYRAVLLPSSRARFRPLFLRRRRRARISSPLHLLAASAIACLPYSMPAALPLALPVPPPACASRGGRGGGGDDV